MEDSFWTPLLGNAPEAVSPWLSFDADRWADFGIGAQLELTSTEVKRLRAFGDPVALEEVRRIYLPLSRMLSAHVESAQALFTERAGFLNRQGRKTPFIIGVAGSVAVGKSTTARVLHRLMGRWATSPKVDLVTTDGFLLPNAELTRRGLMTRKGFPESYDRAHLLRFLADLKAGRRDVRAPGYSHLIYDVDPAGGQVIDQPDILILEGLNILQPPESGRAEPLASDFLDYSIYVDADETHIRDWYVSRFMKLRETAFSDPQSHFHRYAALSDGTAEETAKGIWDSINRPNLLENILPTRPRAQLVLRKGPDHRIHHVALRRL